MSLSLAELAAAFASQRDAIEQWLAAELAKQRVPFYCSVDLRISGHKITPVDTNMFPGGFNNLNAASRAAAAKAAAATLRESWPQAGRIALVVERHTRNPYYTEHLHVLNELLQAGGAQVRIAFAAGPAATIAGHHREIEIGALDRDGDQARIGDFIPDLILLNNDLTGGVPASLQDVAQPLEPPLEAGWSKRRKSTHFFQYERVATRFARAFGLDPWLLEAYFNVCSKVDVSRRIGMDCLARSIDETLDDIQANYERVGCPDKPFVVLKADAGTYGMGVVMVDSAAAALSLNRRERQNLSVIKDGASVQDILVQEGIATTSRVEGLVAEPVYYMVGATVVGGFWRLNAVKGVRDNLNSRGMLFWPMSEASRPSGDLGFAAEVVARLALLASTRELAGDLARASDTV